jgi:hypothetical protein
MQEVVEQFFENAVDADRFSLDLFPEWMRSSVRVSRQRNDESPGTGGRSSAQSHRVMLGDRFKRVHSLLHSKGVGVETRRALAEQVKATNRIQDLCDGVTAVPADVVDRDSELAKSIDELMEELYHSLDLAVFRRGGLINQPTHQMYAEFITRNRYVCPFCGLYRFKNRLGPRREDFDHYLHKAKYPLAAANTKNLVPTCGTCNQDHKKAKDILADGVAFYPYGDIPSIKVDVHCLAYPAPDNFSDKGSWNVHFEVVGADARAALKLTAWDRVYGIRNRLANEIQEFFEEWMKELRDYASREVDGDEFRALVSSAQGKAHSSSLRRMEPGQIIKAAFYEFILHRAAPPFVESFRQSLNRGLMDAH